MVSKFLEIFKLSTILRILKTSEFMKILKVLEFVKILNQDFEDLQSLAIENLEDLPGYIQDFQDARNLQAREDLEDFHELAQRKLCLENQQMHVSIARYSLQKRMPKIMWNWSYTTLI